MTHLFDTDQITFYERATGRQHAALAARVTRHDPAKLSYSIVSFHEQLLGAQAFIGRARAAAEFMRGYRPLEDIHRSYSAFLMLPYGAPVAAVFDLLRSRRIRIATMDLRIASIALARNLILLTRNLRAFAQAHGLRTGDWTA